MIFRPAGEQRITRNGMPAEVYFAQSGKVCIFAFESLTNNHIKTMKKSILLLLFLTSVWLDCQAQSPVPIEIEYDAAGNRIVRKVMQVAKAQYNNSHSDSIYYVDQLQSMQIKIYPNPTLGMVSVEINGSEDGSVTILRIFDSQGRKLQEKAHTERLLDIDISAYPAGNYIVEIIAGAEHTTWKIVKE